MHEANVHDIELALEVKPRNLRVRWRRLVETDAITEVDGGREFVVRDVEAMGLWKLGYCIKKPDAGTARYVGDAYGRVFRGGYSRVKKEHTRCIVSLVRRGTELSQTYRVGFAWSS
ncbi:hypothetical protein BAUCODRAFT_134034 [Baudoinia panamericana UAMH 10762]|uniref:Uncharacterized protein n=1 Tax=Baudoinia panamericana (strain UAMH 10762) TaxID=717646 RepID=M2MZL5_BAUPA|nr:uncharacterized protein BAUCODRAFT_134034 [Baudoinia panamericana UAMH 10762]EMC92109.1 hypothetical protein BAUCODRAFT_134034 [Baudoinia panamericana UAMH 10762]